jgi:Domain of unknown function (DUF4403)
MSFVERSTARRLVAAGLILIGAAPFGPAAIADDKPPLAPDTVVPFTTDSRISAVIEFGLPALASAIEQDIPRRLATIDEEVQCVNRRVLFARIKANCDIYGFVERSGSVSLYGRGDRVYGSVPIYGALEGQGANRFTARVHGETEASATIEAEARPQLNKDWSLELNFSDGFRWSEPPVLHVLGRNIPVSKYAEPRIRAQLAKVRARALAAARRLDLQGKAATAWRRAFDPIQIRDNPATWLQLKPQSAAFAGVRADPKVLRGTLQLAGSAQTLVGQQPPAVTATALPPLSRDIAEPGAFDVILPINIGYDVLKQKISDTLAATPLPAEMLVREVEVYPSSGKLVIGLRLDKPSDADASAGQWVYLSGAIAVADDGHSAGLSDLALATSNDQLNALIGPLLAQLRAKTSVDYGIAYQNLLNAANEKLTHPLKDGFRMEGHLNSAKLEKVFLPADGVVIALRASGELKILYGL